MRDRVRIGLLTIAAVAIVGASLLTGRLVALYVPGIGVPTPAPATPTLDYPPPGLITTEPRPPVTGPWVVETTGSVQCCDAAGRSFVPVPTVVCLPATEFHANPRPPESALHYWTIPLKGAVPDPTDPDDRPAYSPGEPCPGGDTP